MGLAGRSCWSWAGLGLWLARALLAGSIAAGLLFGPEVAGRAWDRGIHVTPGQAAAHAALLAEGFSHHHAHADAPRGAEAAAGGPSLQAGNSGLSWGAPLAPAVQPDLPACLILASCGVLPAPRQLVSAPPERPSSPPPRFVEAA